MDEFFAKIKRSVNSHEDMKLFPYVDTKNKITIGRGYNLTDRGLPVPILESLYDTDVNFFYTQLSTYPWFSHLNDDRKITLIDMCFMGLKRLLGFKNMISCLSCQDFEGAANEMLNSLWADEVGKSVGQRAFVLSRAMRTGIYNI